VAERTARRPSLAANLALTAAALAFSLGLMEAACQAWARLVVFPRFDRDMAKPNFFLARSDDPILAYENRPGFETTSADGKLLRINRHGLRGDSDALFEGARRIALLGDSVTMGAGHSQERTIAALLEQRLRATGQELRVLNFGVPGYATRELLAYLKRKDQIYRVDHALYLLNPNDFARRDSVHEGGDNGLYRMFVRPTWQTPWFVRKAIYRFHKTGGLVPWYEWTFAANEASAQADIRAMAAYCARRGAGFSVVLLPSGEAYVDGRYLLAGPYERLTRFLAAEGIPHATPIAEFANDPKRYFDETDHLWDPGNERMAELLAGFLARIGALGEPGATASVAAPRDDRDAEAAR
jgi:lysophospholipase L1-like esterase